MLDAIGEAVIATDLAGTVTFWNAAAERMYGWRADEVIGRNVVDVTPSDASRDEAERLMACMRRGETWRGRFEVRRRDGSTFPALVTDTPLLDRAGRLAGIIGVSADLTDLEATEQRARRGERHLAVAAFARTALQVPDLDVLLDRAAETVARECRAVLVQVFEHTPGGPLVRGRAGPGAAAAAAHDEAPSGLPVRWFDGVRTRIGFSDEVGGRAGGFGRIDVHVRESQRLDLDEAGFVDAIAGVVGGAVVRADGERELRRVADQLRASDEIRVAFLRATSHELRTPLAAVRGFAETLREHDGALTPEQRLRFLDIVLANTDRLDRLVRDLLDVDRLSSGLGRAIPQRCRFDEVVASVVEAVEHPDHPVVLDLDEVWASLDVPKIERVVENLVANALRHTAAGRRVLVGLHDADGGVLLTVEDEGEGIEPAYLDRIFEPFVQGSDQQQAAAPGAGLGLTLVREITRLHGGHVAAANRPEGGARFEVWLPA